MAAKLVAEEGDLKGLQLSLEDGEIWVIGRDPDACQLVIQDPLVSRRHFIARRTPEGITVENLSSINPIQVNDEEIGNQPRLLQQGDTLKVGNELFRYYEDASAHILTDEVSLEAPLPPPSHPEKYEDATEDTIFDEEDLSPLAEINFGLVETGRWLMKIIGGPNNGAEFHMQAGHSYVLGTDPHSCDIVFHDTSVSRQHAKITVTPEETLLIEDLKSRNGVLIGGSPIDHKQTLETNVIVTLGTTSFVVYDREGEMQTIISPLLPSIVKVLQQEEKPQYAESETPAPLAETTSTEPSPEIHIPPKNGSPHFGPLILLSVIIGLFVLAGMGASALFRTEPVVVAPQENTTELLKQALSSFPAIRYTYQKATNSLLLIGHVATAAEKNQLVYNLQGLKFIKSVDDSGIIIDEYVWQEMNSILSKTSAWKGITIHSPAAGQFILSGYLQTRKQAEQLSDYISLNFPYLDLLKRQVVVEEDVLNQINAWVQDVGLRQVVPKMSNGEISLTGNAPADKLDQVNQLITKIKEIPGVRIVNNYVRTQAAEMGIINLSDRYHVTGESRVGNKYTVVINGRILSEGDNLDGMDIKKITPDTVFLEKEGSKYRIDY